MATAWPILPDERFERYRTGSMGSRVGPEVTRTRSPARSRTGVRSRSSASTIVSTSGSRPLPASPDASAPASGSMHGDAALAERAHVRHHRRMVPHAAVHGGGHQHGTARGEEERGEEIVGDARGRPWRGDWRWRGPRRGPGRARRAPTCSTASGVCGSKRSREHGPPGQRPPGEGADELARRSPSSPP